MHLYWRVQQDLSCLGETIIFHEPCFIRCLQEWVRRNAAGIALAGGYELERWIRPSLN